jgi:hypothetical protein
MTPDLLPELVPDLLQLGGEFPDFRLQLFLGALKLHLALG